MEFLGFNRAYFFPDKTTIKTSQHIKIALGVFSNIEKNHSQKQLLNSAVN
jgi:hypothetical protein